MTESSSLTPKQREIYEFIRHYIQQHGYPPAIRDIGKAFEIKSPNGVMCHLKALKKKGFILRDEKNESQGGRARAMTVPGLNPAAGGFRLPLLGLVAAGPTLEAEAQDEQLDLKELFDGEDLYVLKIRGRSMIESQIADGDYVVIRRREDADNGETVVVMVDGAMTLKKFFCRKQQIILEPCNSDMQPIVVDPAAQAVQILGVLVGVIRRCDGRTRV
jgi:repressor LexA